MENGRKRGTKGGHLQSNENRQRLMKDRTNMKHSLHFPLWSSLEISKMIKFMELFKILHFYIYMFLSGNFTQFITYGQVESCTCSVFLY